MYSYMGRILYVDLSSSTVWEEPLDEALARDYVGGSGLSARMLYDVLSSKGGDIDPLGPDNPLIFMTGPLVGTVMPSAGRCSVCALSPLTGIWGESNTGGFFGPELRFAGYDGLVITGQAASPVWLSLIDGHAELHDAQHLWGSDAYATQEGVRAAMNEPRARVACVGLAGERQVKMAAVMNDHGRAAGRTGMGAVMGAKRLKAVGLRGSSQVPLADAKGLRGIAREIIASLGESMAAVGLQLAGTACYVDMALMFGDLPIRYFQQGEWEAGGNLSGVLMAEQYHRRRTTCYRCPIACGRQTQAPSYGQAKVDGPEYETLGALGTMVMVDDLEAVIYAGHLCNLYGLDTISAGCTIALACEMFDRGILGPADTGGLEIRYGNAAMFHRLLEMTAHREGFGDVLAEGSAALAERFGVPELAATVNRLEVPMHDPRAFVGVAVSYALSPRGACHLQGDMYGVDFGQDPPIEMGIIPGDRLQSSVEKGQTAARYQAWRNLYNALILCLFQNPGADRLRSALAAATGWDLELADLMQIGKRIVTLKRLLNMRRGLTRDADHLPTLLQHPLPNGGTEGTVPDLNTLLSGAYAEYGWDPRTGVPTPETLAGLGLSELATSGHLTPSAMRRDSQGR